MAYTGVAGVWATKLGDFTPKNFPGTATGILEAIAYLGTTGGAILLGVGTFAFGTTEILLLSGSIKFMGSGRRATKLTYSGSGRFITIGRNDLGNYAGGASHILFRDLTLEGPGIGSSATAITDWESGSNWYERVEINQFGTGYFGQGADVVHFIDNYLLKCGKGIELTSRCSQTQFTNCYWAECAIGLQLENVSNTRLYGGQFVFNTTADIVVDAPASPTGPNGSQNRNTSLEVFGTWFESASSPTLNRHVWLGRNGDSTRVNLGARFWGCWVETGNSLCFAEVDAMSRVLIDGIHPTGEFQATGGIVKSNLVAAVFPEITVRDPHLVSGTMLAYVGNGNANTHEFTRGNQAISSAGTGTSFTPNAEAAAIYVLTLNGAGTINAPTVPLRGRILRFVIQQDGAGAWALAWNAVFKHAWSDAGNVANARSTIEFYYNGSNWIQLGAQSPYIV
jgi:hypothetical protein